MAVGKSKQLKFHEHDFVRRKGGKTRKPENPLRSSRTISIQFSLDFFFNFWHWLEIAIRSNEQNKKNTNYYSFESHEILKISPLSKINLKLRLERFLIPKKKRQLTSDKARRSNERPFSDNARQLSNFFLHVFFPALHSSDYSNCSIDGASLCGSGTRMATSGCVSSYVFIVATCGRGIKQIRKEKKTAEKRALSPR